MNEPTAAEVDAYQDAQVADSGHVEYVENHDGAQLAIMQPTYPLTDTELWHWKYRDEALQRQIELIHDTVNMASAYRAPVSREDLLKHQMELDNARYLQAEAKHHVLQHQLTMAEPF